MQAKRIEFLELKLFMNRRKTRYVKCFLYRNKKLMQDAFRKLRPDAKYIRGTLGAHCAYQILNTNNNRTSKETGTIFLSMKNCGAGVVTHEILHGILWAHRFKAHKKQYPTVINNMEQEEELLHDFSFAVSSFYDWYWKVEKQLK